MAPDDYLLASMIMAAVPRRTKKPAKPKSKSKKLIANIAKKNLAKQARKKARK